MTYGFAQSPVWFLSLVIATISQTPYFEGLGFLPGGTDSYSHGISGDGSVAVGQSSGAFRWDLNSGLQLIDPDTTEANDASLDGSVIVGTGHGPGVHTAFRWSELAGMNYLGDLPGGESFSVARSVSADGSVVVGFGSTDLGREAFRWNSDEGMMGLGSLPGAQGQSIAHAVSTNGEIVVGAAGPCCTEGLQQAFRWETGEMQSLGMLPGGVDYAQAYGVSADGMVIVGASESYSTTDGHAEAFRWTASEGMIELGILPGGIGSSAYDASGDGRFIVGASSSETDDAEPFIWNADYGMRNLRTLLVSDFGFDLSGWDLWEARAISDDGFTIVGWGSNPSGHSEAWIAHIPEPSTVLILFAGLAIFRCTRKQSPRAENFSNGFLHRAAAAVGGSAAPRVIAQKTVQSAIVKAL